MKSLVKKIRFGDYYTHNKRLSRRQNCRWIRKPEAAIDNMSVLQTGDPVVEYFWDNNLVFRSVGIKC